MSLKCSPRPKTKDGQVGARHIPWLCTAVPACEHLAILPDIVARTPALRLGGWPASGAAFGDRFDERLDERLDTAVVF
jgi:hypothetical protein